MVAPQQFLSWGLALFTVTAYSFNSQVFVWIGSADFGGKLFELFLFHVVPVIFLPCIFLRGRMRDLLAERGQGSMGYFAGQVILGAFFQMVIYYLWFRASLRLPTQLLAAIFQSSIALVYILSLIFLGERFSCIKIFGVVLAIVGVVIACFANGWFGKSGTQSTDWPEGADLAVGVLLAVCAEISKATYQIWFKRSFGSPSPTFALLFGSLVGAAHIFPILPLIAFLSGLGVSDARMTVSSWTAAQVGLIILAASISGIVNIGTFAVVALRSPIFWSSVQLLAIPISVLFDLAFHGVHPGAFNCIGYAIIMLACPMLTGIAAPKSAHAEQEKPTLHSNEEPDNSERSEHV